ncbi:hypothetical protein [Actinoplanes subglobosus]|uniref:DUF4190 domain-containing protein n=1 Tax=Actinoplanes subglobosus TaxID=1547892 RepID=A0ABV8IVA0_9ACTN
MWFTAALAGLTFGVLVPAQAWAAGNGAGPLIEAATRSRRGGFGVFGILGLVCCVAVVAIIVVVVMLISRNRRRR